MTFVYGTVVYMRQSVLAYLILSSQPTRSKHSRVLSLFVAAINYYLQLDDKKNNKVMKSLVPLRAKKSFIIKKLGHTAISAIKASSVTLLFGKRSQRKILYI